MVFGNGVKNIQAAAYNGARMVGKSCDSWANSQQLTQHLALLSTIYYDITAKHFKNKDLDDRWRHMTQFLIDWCDI